MVVIMKTIMKSKSLLRLSLAALLAALALCACSSGSTSYQPEQMQTEEADTGRFLTVVEDEPDTVDFQCTSIYYTVALNVFDRLVETEVDHDGNMRIVPALAESWTVSDDGCSYTFCLREGVTFSNGSTLTSSDVLYTLTRLLTHPDACNQDIIREIAGAPQLEAGETDRLEGFSILSDREFVITLAQPFEPFLSCLAMPAASILDQETMEAIGENFGTDPACTIGTGPYILQSWEPGKGMLLTRNPIFWDDPPPNGGLDFRFITEAEEQRLMFENGELDILDLDNLGDTAEFFFHGDIYQERLCEAQQIGINYIALNESVKPLDDVRVRKALQLSLDRQMLLDAVYSGRGTLENGIFPRGLKGFDPDLPGIPYDPEAAAQLLAEAGYADGFDLTVCVKSSSTLWERELMDMTASMWEKIGVRSTIEVMDESEFMALRKSGELPCYTARWDADYNDPDNFIYTFFGSAENTTFRSLCYPREDVMLRVRQARTISDEAVRMQEYQALEQTIIQEDAAWIPLFSRAHYYVVGDRVDEIKTSWNGWVSTRYRDIAVNKA